MWVRAIWMPKPIRCASPSEPRSRYSNSDESLAPADWDWDELVKNLRVIYPSELTREDVDAAGGRHPVTPSGRPTKGHKTRRNKRTSNMIIRRRTKR